MDDLIKSCKDGMDNRVKSFDKELTRIRTGRASINMLEGIKIDYYGSPTALSQVATLTTPDARTIVISPYEKNLIQAIEKSIMIADLGLQPNNDGNVVRVPVPALTEERRKEIAKSLKKMGEDAKIGLRKVRKEANDTIKKAEKNKDIGEDEVKKLQALVQKETDVFVKKIDERVSTKEKEVMKV